MSYGEPECRDCGLDTLEADEYYMLHNHVWAATGSGPADGMLCIGCAELRLGRRLTPADFTNAPVNRGGIDSYFEQSDRLRSRAQPRPT